MWRFVQNFNLFCGSFLLLFSWKSGSFVEVLWLWNLNKNCDSDIWTNTLWLNTILFVVCWSLLFFSFATIIGYVQKLIVLLTKTHFRTWLWETSSCGVWLTNIWSLDSLHSCLALGIHKHGCFSICIFRLVFVKNTFFFLGLDSLNSIPVVLHKHDGLIVDQYLFSDCILEKMIWNLIRENFKVWQFALLTSRPSHAWTICLSIVAKLVWNLI